MGKRVAVIWVGVSNTPLIKMLRRRTFQSPPAHTETAGGLGGHRGAGEPGRGDPAWRGYLEGWTRRHLPVRPARLDVPQLRGWERGSLVTRRWRSFQVHPQKSSGSPARRKHLTTTTIIAESLEKRRAYVLCGGNIGKPPPGRDAQHGARRHGRAGAVLLPAHDYGRQPLISRWSPIWPPTIWMCTSLWRSTLPQRKISFNTSD